MLYFIALIAANELFQVIPRNPVQIRTRLLPLDSREYREASTYREAWFTGSPTGSSHFLWRDPTKLANKKKKKKKKKKGKKRNARDAIGHDEKNRKAIKNIKNISRTIPSIRKREIPFRGGGSLLRAVTRGTYARIHWENNFPRPRR